MVTRASPDTTESIGFVFFKIGKVFRKTHFDLTMANCHSDADVTVGRAIVSAIVAVSSSSGNYRHFEKVAS